MQISKEIQFDYGHCVTHHESLCKNLHGHRARVVIVLEGDVITAAKDSQQGMVMDFGHIKALAMQHIHDVLDHAFVIWDQDPRAEALQQLSERVVVVPFVPTAECLAKWCYEQLVDKFADVYGTGLRLQAIHFYETPTSCAVYAG